jgi:hypothetical protein
MSYQPSPATLGSLLIGCFSYASMEHRAGEARNRTLSYCQQPYVFV